MSSEISVTFDSVSKIYNRFRPTDIRATLAHLRERWFNSQATDKANNRYLCAVEDVSFDIHGGEAVGIIGPNGAGKTTMLSLMAGVTLPTKGEIRIAGKVAALIQHGAGFHPELSGTENIYLNAAIMGLSRQRVEELFQKIVEFAELEKFIDMPLKRYSSGMYARLGFSVAAHLSPDILLVDEALA